MNEERQKGKILTPIFTILIATVGIIFFLKNSNNHNECENVKSIEVLDNGTKIETTTHICNEKFNI